MKSYLRFILYQNMKKKLGVTLHPKALQWILYRHVFAHVCYVLQKLARTVIILNGRSFRY